MKFVLQGYWVISQRIKQLSFCKNDSLGVYFKTNKFRLSYDKNR